MNTNHPRCLYESSIRDFLAKEKAAVFGVLCEGYHGDALTTQREAWMREIDILQGIFQGQQNPSRNTERQSIQPQNDTSQNQTT